MKKINLLACLLLMVLLVTGCAKEENNSIVEPGYETTTSKIKGDWTTNTSTTIDNGLTTEEKEIFESATINYDGVSLEPLTVLGTKIVNGKDYMYLCKGTPVTQNPETSWKIVVINQDSAGSSSIKKVEDFDYAKFAGIDIEIPLEEEDGSYVANKVTGKVTMDDSSTKSFDKVIGNLEGMTYNKIALLGTESSKGTTRAFLVSGTYKDNKSELTYIYVMTIYEEDGFHELSNTAYVDLDSLVK